MSGPISPNEVGAYKTKSFPPEVFDAFNELIAEHYVDGRAQIKQNEVQALIIAKLGDETKFKFNYLNVEEAYQEAGWKVEYDKPAYNESYAATFTFRKK